MVLILTFDFVVKHILKAPGYLCICCHGLRPMLCLKKTFPVWEELTSPMLASSCVTSVRDNMRSWGGLPQILTSHHPLVLHSQPERPRDDCAGITQLMCFSLLSSFRSTFQAVKVSFTQTFLESEVESSYIAAKCFEQSNEFWSSSLASPSSSCCQMIC